MAKLNGDYFQIPNIIFECCENPYQISVLSYLLRCRNNETDDCYPSYKTIANACHISRYQAIRTIKRLMELSLIQLNAKPFKSNGYAITLTSQPHRLVNDIDPTSQCGRPVLVNDIDPNNTNRKKLIKKTNKNNISSTKGVVELQKAWGR